MSSSFLKCNYMDFCLLHLQMSNEVRSSAALIKQWYTVLIGSLSFCCISLLVFSLSILKYIGFMGEWKCISNMQVGLIFMEFLNCSGGTTERYNTRNSWDFPNGLCDRCSMSFAHYVYSSFLCDLKYLILGRAELYSVFCANK